jgi:SAM-dependent methyltransferase
VQRPWVLKALLGALPPRARLLEIGAGEPFVADLLSRLGHEVWVVDPYDGTGNGPREYDRYRCECPQLRFVRDLFGDRLQGPPERAFDAIYSISVLEHVPGDALRGVYAGLRRFLKPEGCSIHAVDHVHRGAGAAEHLASLRDMAAHLAAPRGADLEETLAAMERDVETYYLSAESHNRWRGDTPYDRFPMRVCVSVQMFARARDVLAAR